MCWNHGRNEVRWRPGQEASLAPQCSKLSSFGSKFTVLKKVLVTLMGLSAPHNDSASGELRTPCPLDGTPTFYQFSSQNDILRDL